MFQLLHLDVSKVDQVLHMGFAWEAAGGAENVRGSARPLLVRSLAPSLCGHCPDASARIGHPDTSKSETFIALKTKI
jgi:hypothetical protein